MKIYKSFLLAAAFVGMFTSCSDKGYWDAYEAESDNTYSFTQSGNTYKLGGNDELHQVVVTLQRSNNDTNDTIPLNVKLSSNIMSVANEAIFEAGKYTSDVIINVNNENIQIGVNYTAELSFLVDSVKFFEHNYSVSGHNSYKLSFVKEYTWVPVGTALYREGLVGLFFGVENVVYEVAVEQAVEEHGYIRLVNPYGAAYPYNSPGDYDTKQKHYMTLNCVDPEGVYIDGYHYSGMDWGYGEFIFASIAYYYMQKGNPFEAVKAAGYCGTINEDLVITFPAGGILIAMANYNNGGLYQTNKTGAFAIDLSTADLLE